jgi:hypothetical protein
MLTEKELLDLDIVTAQDALNKSVEVAETYRKVLEEAQADYMTAFHLMLVAQQKLLELHRTRSNRAQA